MTQESMARETDKDRLDKLIDWYNQNKPEPGRVIRVKFPVKELVKFATPTERPDRFAYRNVILERASEQRS